MAEKEIDAIVELKKWKDALNLFDKRTKLSSGKTIFADIQHLDLNYDEHYRFLRLAENKGRNRYCTDNEETIKEVFQIAMLANMDKILKDTREGLEWKINQATKKARAEFDALVGVE